MYVESILIYLSVWNIKWNKLSCIIRGNLSYENFEIVYRWGC